MDSASSSPDTLKELTTSRARFIAELGERLGALRHGLARMATLAEPTPELNAVRRRLHALAAAAEVLRFAAASQALAAAEATLATAAGAAPGAPARERVARILDLLPSLVLGISLELEAELDAQRHRALREPLCVLVYGAAELEALLHAPGPLRSAETRATADPEELLDWMGRLAPDVLLIDADAAVGASDLLPRVQQAAGSHLVPVVGVGSFDQHEPLLRLVRRGVSRLQPRPVDAGTLQRTLRQVSPSATPPPARTADFRRLTPEQLVEAIAAEARKAFADPESKARPSPAIDFGSGVEVLASLWGAFARIRGLAAEASEGVVRFTSPGPHGVVPMAPTAGEAAAVAVSVSRPVSLAGRRFIVVDDDGAALTLLSRALSQLGAVVLPARDVTQALELAEQHWPDAVISDTLLPGSNGFELCQRIREDIALADLPVALVAWREHLLSCVPSAGDARAPGALAIEPSSVARALTACLLERGALERRLANHQEVHGRIDGLTPRLLLQLVCGRAPNALLTLQSGRLRCELGVVDGRPVHAQLYDEGQSVAEGQAALGPFLGLRAGRFSVRPLFAPPAAHLSGDLMTVLAPAITRARRARALLREGELSSIERVVLDAHAVAHYLEESPGSQRSLVARLEEGAPPRALATASEAPGSGEAPRVLAVLLELARRGAVRVLLDKHGHDLLSPGSPALEAPAPRATPPTTPTEVPSAAQSAERERAPAIALGEAVLHAVSARMEPPSAAGTHRSLAAPEVSPPPPASAATSSAPPSAPTSSAPTSVSVRSPISTPLPTSPPPSTSREPREVTEAWSSEPEDDDSPLDDDADDQDEPRDGAESYRSASPGAGLRSLASPVLVTLGAAALAFLGIRAVTGGGWQTLSAALQGAPPPLVDAGATPRLAAAPPRANPAEPAGEELGLLAEQRKIPVDITFTSELLDLPPNTKLRPGHGLLEVHTWEPQRIYVDGVFMGNYESRLIPLGPGTYQLRLRDAARDMERSVQVEAGRRTRLLARPKSSK